VTDGNVSAAPASEQDVVAANKIPAKPAMAPIVIRKVGSQPGLAKAASVDAPMPSITGIASAGNDGPLPNLLNSTSKAPTPVLQTVNVSQGVSQGLVIKKTTPSYPANALRMHVEGSVQLLATISKRGDISAVKVISGDPNLARAASDAVKQWKYKPYLLDGSPVEIQTQVTVNFKLPH
jgi:protein TonB